MAQSAQARLRGEQANALQGQALAQADREASKSRAEQLIAEALEQAKTSLAQSRSSGLLAEQANADGAQTAGAPDCCKCTRDLLHAEAGCSKEQPICRSRRP